MEKIVKVQNKTTSKTKIKSEGKSIFKYHHHFTVDLNLTIMAPTQNTLPQTHSSFLWGKMPQNQRIDPRYIPFHSILKKKCNMKKVSYKLLNSTRETQALFRVKID